MIQRIRFGTVEQVVANIGGSQPKLPEQDRLVQEGLVNLGDYILRFSGYMTQLPAHSDFPAVMTFSDLQWNYPGRGSRPFEATDEQQGDSTVLVFNGASIVTPHKGRIFQLAHNVMHVARQIPIGGADEMIEFLDLSGALPENGNAFHY